MEPCESPQALDERIRQFILTSFYAPNPMALSVHASLLDLGILDSEGVLEVVLFPE